MKTHRIILPAAQQEAALRGVDRLLLPMREQPARDSSFLRMWTWSSGGASIETNREDLLATLMEGYAPYKSGDRLALLERWDSYEEGRWFIYTQNHPDAERFLWKPASRMPLRACRCFYRVLGAEPVREGDAWAWAVRVEQI